MIDGWTKRLTRASSTLALVAAAPAAAQVGEAAPPVMTSGQASVPATHLVETTAGATETLKTADGSGAGDIIVTARRSAENIQRTPVAVTALSNEVFSKGGTFNPLDFGQLAAGLSTVGSAGQRAAVVYSIRGQSSTFGNSFPSVIPYFAEVPVLSRFSTGSFFDLQSVQVLRGPQGVRFGRVTNGGAVLIQPHKPTNQLEGYGQVTLGDYNLLNLEAVLNVPIVDDAVLLRLSGQRARRQGFTRNILTGRNLDDVGYQTGRVSLTVKPVSWFRNDTVFEYNSANENGNAGAIILFREANFAASPASIAALRAAVALQRSLGPRQVANGSPLGGEDYGIFERRRQILFSNITTIDLTDHVQFRNVLGYTRLSGRTGYDYDGSSFVRIDSFNRILPQVFPEQYSEEARLGGDLFDKVVNWSIGAYFDHQKPAGRFESVNFGSVVGTTAAANANGSFIRASTKSSAYSGSLEVDLASLLSGLKVNGGIRQTHDTNTSTFLAYSVPAAVFVAPGFPHGVCSTMLVTRCTTQSVAFNATTYEMGASFQASHSVFTYLSYRKGYRPGAFNSTVSPISPNGSYQPEYNGEWEVGLKVSDRIAGMPFHANIAAFHDNYTNIQKRIGYTVPGGGQALTLVLNAAEATVRGIEFEGGIRPTSTFDLSVNASLVDAAFSKGNLDLAALNNPVNGACNPTVTFNLGFCPLNRFASTPRFQGTLSAGYTLPLAPRLGRIRVGGDLYHRSSMAFSDASAVQPETIGRGYTLLNLNVDWSDVGGRPVDISLFITNVTNKLYQQGIQSASQRASAGVAGQFYGPPRMTGGSVRIRF